MSGPVDIACIILAAGRSTRMGAANKLLEDIGGQPMARVVARVALASAARPVVAVTGHQADAVRQALSGLDLTFAANPDYAQGLSTSLKTGIRTLPPCAGVIVLLADMPQVTAAHLDTLIAAFIAGGRRQVVVPTHGGRRGNPVLWPEALLAEMLQLEGDAGARSLMTRHADLVREVDLGTAAVLADVDTPDALAAVRRLGR